MNIGDSRLPERFWQKVAESENGCWEWQATKTNGYGMFRLNQPRRTRSAHRIAYETLVGPVEQGLDLDHLCRNRACCNPQHLEPVTRQVNLLRGKTLPAGNAARTHCRKGHELSGVNLRIRTRGNGRVARECIACTRAADRARYAKDPKSRYPTYIPRERKVILECRNGHPFTEANTIHKSNGTKRCRICTNRYQVERRARLTAKQESP